MLSKKARKQRRAYRNSYKVKSNNLQGLPRLVVDRTERHIRCQLIDVKGDTIMSVDSNTPALKDKLKGEAKSYNVAGAKIVGIYMAELMKKNNIDKYIFDRRSFKYHGRVKALNDGIQTIRSHNGTN